MLIKCCKKIDSLSAENPRSAGLSRSPFVLTEQSCSWQASETLIGLNNGNRIYIYMYIYMRMYIYIYVYLYIYST